MALIELDQIAKVYQGDGVLTRALSGVSLAISEGEYMAIMGASGSGKSTLLHILGLLDRPSAGRYLFDGQDTSKFTDEQYAATRNKNIGFVFQSFHLLARTTVLENVMLPLQYSQVPKREWKNRALKVLEQVSMGHRLQHIPTQLSGGEKQRVAIARALITNPKLILADEPTGNLDSKNGAAVMDLIQALHSSGHTIVLVTHEREAALQAQRMITMRDGAVVEDEKVASMTAAL